MNSGDKGALAKLIEAISTNYNDRYDEICHHLGSNILCPKSVAHSSRLEEAKAEEVASKLGQVYAVEFSVCRSNGLLQKKEKKKKFLKRINFSERVNFANKIQISTSM